MPPFAAERQARRDPLFLQGLADRTAIPVDDGWIVGLNSGEWGGSAWWFAPDGGQRYQIIDGNIVRFIPTRRRPLMLEGVVHASLNRGQLFELTHGASRRWVARPVLDLGCAPEAATLLGDDVLIVVGSDRLLRVDLTARRVKILVADAF